MNLFKKLYLVALATVLSAASWSIQAQESMGTDGSDTAAIIRQIEESGFITINIPEGLNAILSFNEQDAKNVDENAVESTRVSSKIGYRVQVFDDNNVRTAKTAAQERKNMIESRFPEFHGYIQFNSPYWRVKVGDFRTRSEAEAAMGAIRAAFPSIGSQLRVVRDKINTR